MGQRESIAFALAAGSFAVHGQTEVLQCPHAPQVQIHHTVLAGLSATEETVPPWCGACLRICSGAELLEPWRSFCPQIVMVCQQHHVRKTGRAEGEYCRHLHDGHALLFAALVSWQV